MSLSKNEREWVINLFMHSDEILKASYMKRKLLNRNYILMDKLLIMAINGGFLVVDSIFPLKLFLSEEGVRLWEENYELE